VADRQQLLDVGAAGPWAGFVVAVLLLAAGLSVSQPLPVTHGQTSQLIMVAGSPWYLGDSIVMWVCRRLMAGTGVLLLHPLAVAGWLGLFVTALNLLPVGQLDGGHVLYALVGRGQAWVGLATWIGLVIVGRSFPGWWIWAVFTLILGRGSIAHPTVLDRYRRLPARRQPLGWATALLFILTFTPVPFYI
jgi:membrane-associated protease RseP (regulator of RpoE activity)